MKRFGLWMTAVGGALWATCIALDWFAGHQASVFVWATAFVSAAYSSLAAINELAGDPT